MTAHPTNGMPPHAGSRTGGAPGTGTKPGTAPLTIVALLALTLGAAPARSQPNLNPPQGPWQQLTLQAHSDQPVFGFRELMFFGAQICNPTGEEVVVTLGCPGCPWQMFLLDADGQIVDTRHVGGFQVVVEVTWAPHSCSNYGFVWEWHEPFEAAPPGIYRVRIDWEPNPSPELMLTATTGPFHIGGASPEAIPALSYVGMVVFVCFLSFAAFVVIRRRREPVASPVSRP